MSDSNFVDLVQHNVRGIRAIVRNEDDPTTEMVKKHLMDYNIVCLTETWILEEEEHHFERFFNCKYVTASATKDKQKGGRNSGGCAIMWTGNHPIEKLATGKYFCAVDVVSDFGTMVLVCVYLPYDGRNREQDDKFSKALNDEVSAFLDSVDNPYVCVVGDFNCDMKKSSKQRIGTTNRFLARQNLTFHDLNFDIPFTYEHENGTCSYVDHTAISAPLAAKIPVIDVDIQGIQVSDHHPMFVNFDASFAQRPDVCVTHDETVVQSVALHRVKEHHINTFRAQFELSLSKFSTLEDVVVNCIEPDCTVCVTQLELFAKHLVNAFTDSAECLPLTKPPPKHKKVGWCEALTDLKAKSSFWCDIWKECERPTTGHVADIRRQVCKEYKVAVRAWLRRQKELREERAGLEFLEDPTNACNRIFQSRKRMSKTKRRSLRVENRTEPNEIANIFATKYNEVYNISAKETSTVPIFDGISRGTCAQIYISEASVLSAIKKMKAGKSDSSHIFSDYITWVSDHLAEPFSKFVTCCFRHGFLPSILADAVLCPIPKKGKDPETTDGYRSIALASQLSKLIEYIILEHFGHCLVSSDLQFSYKAKTGTTACTSIFKATVEHFVGNGVPVNAALLDMSRAFDFVRHDRLIQELAKRGLHENMQRFLYSWYKSQKLKVRFGNIFSRDLPVSNGVRQGGVVSPLLFTIYMDILLGMLRNEGAGCHVDSIFVGALCYADDLTLIAPSISALRRMLAVCEVFADRFGMKFNASKSQLIQFGTKGLPSTAIFFAGSRVEWVNEVVHLGVNLTSDLKDTADTNRICNRMYSVCYSMLAQYPHLNPAMKTRIFNTLACDLYGSVLWRANRQNFQPLNVAYNQCLRKIWKVSMCHVPILRAITRTTSASSMIRHRFKRFLASMLKPTGASQIGAAVLYFCANNSPHTTIHKNVWCANFPPEPDICEDSIRKATLVREIRICPEIFKFFGYCNSKYLIEYLCWGTRI